jgi:hypothetical protein
LVKVFDGDKEDPDCPVREEKIIAWNQVDAIRRVPGDIVEQPEAINFVTWDDPPLMIKTTAGPERDVADPTIEPVDDW